MVKKDQQKRKKVIDLVQQGNQFYYKNGKVMLHVPREEITNAMKKIRLTKGKVPTQAQPRTAMRKRPQEQINADQLLLKQEILKKYNQLFPNINDYIFVDPSSKNIKPQALDEDQKLFEITIAGQSQKLPIIQRLDNEEVKNAVIITDGRGKQFAIRKQDLNKAFANINAILAGTNNQLTDQQNMLGEQIEHLTEEREILQQQAEELSDQLQINQFTLKQVQDTLDEAQMRSAQKQILLSKREDEIAELQKRIEQKQVEYEENLQRVEQVTRATERLVAEQKKQEAISVEQQRAVQKLNQQRALLEKDFQQKESVIREQTERLTKLRLDRQKEQELRDQLMQQKKLLSQEFDQKRKEIEKQTAELVRLEEQKISQKALQEEIEKRQQERMQLEETIRDQRKTLTGEIQGYRQQLVQLEEQKQKADDERKEAVRQKKETMTKTKNKIAQIGEVLNQKENQLKNIERNLEKAQSFNQQLQGDIQQLQEDKIQLQQANLGMITQNKLIETNLVQNREALRKTNIEMLQKQIDLQTTKYNQDISSLKTKIISTLSSFPILKTQGSSSIQQLLEQRTKEEIPGNRNIMMVTALENFDGVVNRGKKRLLSGMKIQEFMKNIVPELGKYLVSYKPFYKQETDQNGNTIFTPLYTSPNPEDKSKFIDEFVSLFKIETPFEDQIEKIIDLDTRKIYGNQIRDIFRIKSGADNIQNIVQLDEQITQLGGQSYIDQLHGKLLVNKAQQLTYDQYETMLGAEMARKLYPNDFALTEKEKGELNALVDSFKQAIIVPREVKVGLNNLQQKTRSKQEYSPPIESPKQTKLKLLSTSQSELATSPQKKQQLKLELQQAQQEEPEEMVLEKKAQPSKAQKQQKQEETGEKEMQGQGITVRKMEIPQYDIFQDAVKYTNFQHTHQDLFPSMSIKNPPILCNLSVKHGGKTFQTCYLLQLFIQKLKEASTRVLVFTSSVDSTYDGLQRIYQDQGIDFQIYRDIDEFGKAIEDLKEQITSEEDKYQKYVDEQAKQYILRNIIVLDDISTDIMKKNRDHTIPMIFTSNRHLQAMVIVNLQNLKNQLPPSLKNQIDVYQLFNLNQNHLKELFQQYFDRAKVEKLLELHAKFIKPKMFLQITPSSGLVKINHNYIVDL